MRHDIAAPRVGVDARRAASAPGTLVRLYGLIAYGTFIATIGYFWLFVGGLLVPKTLDRGASPVAPALAIDLAVIALFGLQHSLMARASFKRGLAHLLPASMERSTFVLVSGLMLVLLFWLWQPIPALVWRVDGAAAVLLSSVFYLGVALALASTFAISHGELFGLLQSRVLPAAGQGEPGLRLPLLYRIVRHPMHLGMLATLWATSLMTAGHLLFSLAMSVYMLIGIHFEERDLVRRFGDEYRAYRRRVPALLFFLRPSWPRLLRVSFFLVAVALGVTGARSRSPIATSETPVEALITRDSVLAAGRVRTFDYYAPPGAPVGAPIVIALHGTGGTGRRFRGFLGGELERLAARHGFVVAYPQAFEGAWNSCRTTPNPATLAGVNDVAMVREVVRHLTHLTNADPGRTVAIGYSGGGHLVFRLALEAPDVLSGAVVIGANLPADRYSSCHPVGHTVPLLIVNGTADLVNPYEGGPATAPLGGALGHVRSTRETGAFFGALAGAVARQPEVILREPSGTPVVERVVWPGRGGAIALYTVHRGGHTIPGPRTRTPDVVGRTERRWSALEEAVRFFALDGAPRP